MSHKYTFTGGGGWLDQVGLKLTQSSAKAEVEVGTDPGNNAYFSKKKKVRHSRIRQPAYELSL